MTLFEKAEAEYPKRPTTEQARTVEMKTVESREEALEVVEKQLRDRLNTRYSKQSETALDFHRPEHSFHVAETAREFLAITHGIDPDLVAKEDIELVYIKGLAHDLVQEAKEGQGAMLQRKRGYNERRSGEELAEILRGYRYRNGEEAFDETIREQAIADIETTCPQIEPGAVLPDGSKGLKISYPQDMTGEGSLSVLALASADLRGEFLTGRDPQAFVDSGTAEFRELHIALGAAVQKSIDSITDDERATFAKQILDWERAQPGFAKWQEILFQESIEKSKALKLSPKAGEIRMALKKAFDGFEAGRKAVEDFSKRLDEQYGKLESIDDATFRELLKEMGYDVTHEE